MFGPLNFKDQKVKTGDNQIETPCLLCDDVFNLKICFDIFLKHLFEVHCLVIEDVQNIKKLECYINYWKNRFKETSHESIVPAISLDSTGIKYFLLSTLTKDDNELRQKLSLEDALETQELERQEKDFKKECLFCRLSYEGSRTGYVVHLSEQHNLQLGNPQNLVYIEEFLQQIEAKLNNLQCLYCEKTFPERTVLKEHMRKKIHKRINPQNHDYDKYYIINYLGERKRSKESDEDAPTEDTDQNADAEYFDWTERDEAINCLFCQHVESDINKLCLHMHTVHKFNFHKLSASLDFYQRVKLVNYIRRQIHLNRCPTCDTQQESLQDLLIHFREEKHCQELPEIERFDQPEFYFPTYENDAFLYFLEDLE